ncbi:sensor histidine kinase [Streptomonospora sp. S1-112]|uniref:histidine kinase n=1 Tax=Streptomonospora mangrovi TaxID=2883123 RepID=A0A9X3SE90_9ACTN|nr:sensor histidine kinase [Streptomonospora mangrovi]MDA0565648.1 sensor histidine kinase [Streptomonospora mangrovi]
MAIAVAVFSAGFVLLHSGAYASRDASTAWATTEYGYPAPLLVGTLALVCVGVSLRYRAPLLGLAIGTVGFVSDIVIGASLATILIYTDNIYAACTYGPRSTWRLMLMVTTTMSIVMGGVVFAMQRHLAGSIILMAVIAAVLVSPVVTAAVVRQTRDRAEDARLRAEQTARLAELDRRNAVATERTRMARELHDSVATRLSIIVLQSTALLARDDLDAETRRRLLTTIREDSTQGLAELRGMIDVLRDERDEEPVAVPRRMGDIHDLAESLGEEATLHVEGEPRPLPPAVELAAFRIVQESVTNALKHSGGPAHVRVTYREDEIELTIENAMTGSAVSRLPSGSLGLTGMRERAEVLGGAFSAGPVPGSGDWRVRAVLPAKAATEAVL